MLIPKTAQQVFKGLIFDVYQWPQKQFDGSTRTFEALKRPNTVQVIATQGDKILLAKEQQPTKGPCFTLLGGRQEPGEKPLEAAQRELLEESGLMSDDWELLKTYEPIHKMEWLIYLYVARNCQRVQEQQLDPGEKITVKQLSFDEFIKRVIGKNFWGKELALDILKMKVEGKLAAFQKKIFKRMHA